MPGDGTPRRLEHAARAIRTRARQYRLKRIVAISQCPNLVRLGSAYGGYVIPIHLPESSWVAYCGGVGEDASFELELSRRYRCQVFAFDPTPRAIQYAEDELKSSGVSFLPYGLWSHDGEQRFYEPRRPEDASYSIDDLQETERFIVATCRSLESLMSELGHDRLNLLKLDVEGAEYHVLEPVVENRIRVDVLCVEAHPTPSFDAMPNLLRRLESVGYGAVHLEGTALTLVDASYLA